MDDWAARMGRVEAAAGDSILRQRAHCDWLGRMVLGATGWGADSESRAAEVQTEKERSLEAAGHCWASSRVTSTVIAKAVAKAAGDAFTRGRRIELYERKGGSASVASEGRHSLLQLHGGF